jgi:hypothetical protein
MWRWTQRLALALMLLLEGCLLDIAPRREPVDDEWNEHMLAGEYGQWTNGSKSPSVAKRDEIESWPPRAAWTRYGIDVEGTFVFSGGAWLLQGGMVARVTRPGASVELFGKMITRVHGPWFTATDRDSRFEFLLVVRPAATGRGRLVRQWSFPREELTLTVPPKRAEWLRTRYSGAELEKHLAESKQLLVEGFLSLDDQSKTVTVTITGLVQPFQERVDLSHELSWLRGSWHPERLSRQLTPYIQRT